MKVNGRKLKMGNLLSVVYSKSPQRKVLIKVEKCTSEGGIKWRIDSEP